MKLIDEGFDIVALTASCGLMLKFEWPLILPENEDVQKLAKATFDIDEYVVDIAKKEGLPAGLKALPEGVTVHLPCHARAQAMGPKAAEMLKLIPDTPIDVIERCSGHGGTFGVMKETHALAVKVGRPVFRAAAEAGARPYRLGLSAGRLSTSSRTSRRWRPRTANRRQSRRLNIPSRSWPAPIGLLEE